VATTTTYRAIVGWTGFSKTRGTELKGEYKLAPQRSAGLQKQKKRIPTSFYDWLLYYAILARGLAVSDRRKHKTTLRCFRARNIGKAYAYCRSLEEGIMIHSSLGIIWPSPKFDIASSRSVSFTTEQRMLIPSDFRELLNEREHEPSKCTTTVFRKPRYTYWVWNGQDGDRSVCWLFRSLGEAYTFARERDDRRLYDVALGELPIHVLFKKLHADVTKQRQTTNQQTADSGQREGYWFEFWQSHGTRLLNDIPVAIYDIGLLPSVRSKTKQTWDQWFADQDSIRENYQYHKQFDRKGGR
jgi:hypothetical protein